MDESKSLNKTFQLLFETKKCADVIFLVHGKELHAHKLVVTSRSAVLETMIDSDLAPKDGKHLITDPEISYKDFENFLLFLYTDNCKIDKEIVGIMLHLSNFYNVKYLADQCIEFIKTIYHISYLLTYLELGLLYADTCPLLLEVSISQLQICINFYGLCHWNEGSAVQWISSELVLKIVQNCPRNEEDFTEDCLFRRIFDWAIKGRNDIDQENLKFIFKPLIPFIKFENLELSTLKSIVKENNLLDYSTLHNVMDIVISKSGAKEKLLQQELLRRNPQV